MSTSKSQELSGLTTELGPPPITELNPHLTIELRTVSTYIRPIPIINLELETQLSADLTTKAIMLLDAQNTNKLPTQQVLFLVDQPTTEDQSQLIRLQIFHEPVPPMTPATLYKVELEAVESCMRAGTLYMEILPAHRRVNTEQLDIQ